MAADRDGLISCDQPEIACPACHTALPSNAKFCPECGTRAPDPRANEEGRMPEGERRQLTVLFCDLVGSTPLSQQLDPEEWRDVLARYQAIVSGAVARWGGHVAKNLGDGLLIYFGWPRAREEDPERAIRAGLAILDAIGARNADAADATQLAARIGMHTGPVVIADGGEVFGETPNVAARVQAAAAPDTVVITAATQRLVAGVFVVEDLGPQSLKGVRDPLTLYRVVQPSGVRSRLDVAAGRLTPFVGRGAELAVLLDGWERARGGRGQSILVVGEAGVGKSRLVYQLRQRLAAWPHTWLECAAAPYTTRTPFHPVIALVTQGLGLLPADTVAEKMAKIEAGLGTLASPESIGLLAAFLGLPPPTPLQMSADVQRRRTIELLAQWTVAIGTVQPLVLLIEDLHWCDVSTLELLSRLLTLAPTTRLLLVATARPESMPDWSGSASMTPVQVGRLGRSDARDMVLALAGTTLPAATIESLLGRAEGVPLWVEELTKAVVEPRTVARAEDIPATLADSLMARLDRLAAAKEVAQRAAVLGREFSYELLAAVAGLDEAHLQQALERLVAAEILFQRGAAPMVTYIFKHALVQEAAYASLLRRTRQQIHGRVADVLVGTFPERAAAEPEVLARHAEIAGRIGDAIAYYERAGSHAQLRSAHEEAMAHLRHALTLLASQPESPERDAQEITLQLALGGSLTIARGFTHVECELVYERARALCEAVGDVRNLGYALVGLCFFHTGRGDPERGWALATSIFTAAERSGDTDVALHGHVQAGALEFYRGRFASALTHSRTAQSLYDPDRHHWVVSAIGIDPGVAAGAWTAWSNWHLGWPDRALVESAAAIALARRFGHPFSLAFALLYETAVHWLRRDLAMQIDRGAETMALSEAHDFPRWLGPGRTFHAAGRVAGGESVALADVLAGLAMGAEAGNQAGAPGLLALLAESYLHAGMPAEARGAIDMGRTFSAQMGQCFWDADLLRLEGEILVAGSASADAEPLFRQALDMARAQGARGFELRAATSLARLLRHLGRRTEARDVLAPVYGWFTEGFGSGDVVAAQTLLAELR